MKKHEILRWYRWGNEKPGYVSTWRLGEDGSSKHLGEMPLMDAIHTPGAVRDCPHN